MNTDIEDLVRSTLHEHASVIDTGPRWDGARPQRARHWPIIAAAAAVVLAVAGGAAWRIGTSNPDLSGGRLATSCNATLPPAWRTALDGPAFSIGGYTPPVIGVLSDGSAVATPVGGRYGDDVVLIDTSGKVIPIYQLPRGGLGLNTEVSGHTVVLNISTAPKGSHTISTRPTDIVDIDTRTRRVTHLLRHVPPGLRARPAHGRTGAATNDAVLQDGVAYWTAAGRDLHHGLVVGYDLRTHRYRKVGTYSGAAYLDHDARGVFWGGGAIPAPHLPPQVASLADRTNPRNFLHTDVVTDGTHYAWSQGQTVHWAGPDGEHADYRVPEIDHGGSGGVVYSVAGPFVLMYTAADAATFHVLDTATGALADTGIEPAGPVAGLGSTLYLDRSVKPGLDETIPVDTAKLPGLTC